VIVALRANIQKQMEVTALIVQRANILQVHQLLVLLALWDVTQLAPIPQSQLIP